VLWFLFYGVPAISQSQCHHPATRAWIRIEDANQHKDTLWFGYDSLGTDDCDEQLCEICPAEVCGPPTDVFCTWWNLGNAFSGEGLIRYNYHAYHTRSETDTFYLGFQAGPPPPRYPVKISWSRDMAKAIYDSVVIQDIFGGVAIHERIDQHDSLLISNVGVHSLVIIGYGAVPLAVSPVSNEIPNQYILSQNYPNPFNPTTDISYSIPKSSFVNLKIYDVLGRELQCPVNRMMEPGNYSVTIDGTNLSAGVYFYRLRAGQFTDVKKFLLIK
jgi:hypothetical protein